MHPAICFRIAFWVLLILIYPLKSLLAQNFPVPGGTVYPGVQTCFPFAVSGLPPGNPLGNPGNGPWPLTSIDSFCVNIVTSHPWTLEVTLVSPNGTILTLSSFNGAGGTNYTSTCFTPTSVTPIVGAPAPFTGEFQPQQTPPGFSIFNGEYPNGIWQLCILDTLTDSTSLAPGPPGIGATSTASGSMGIGTTSCAPCTTFAVPNLPPMDYFDVCPYDNIDFLAPYAVLNPNLNGLVMMGYDMFGNPTSNANLFNGTIYTVAVFDPCSGGCMFGTTVTLYGLPDFPIGANQTIDQCENQSIDLNALMMVNGANPDWFYNSSPISTAAASSATLPGNYVVNVPPLLGFYCAVSGFVTINTATAPDIGPDQTITGCTIAPYDLTTLYTTSGLTANWYLNGSAVSNPSAVVGNGNYMLVVDSANGCRDTAIVTINLTASPVLGPDQIVDFCGTGAVNLSTLYNTAGYTAIWTFGGSPVANPNSVNAAGPYTLIANNSNGCADTAIVTLNMLSTPALGPDQTIIGCTVAAYDLTALFNTTGLTTNWYRNGNPVANPAAVMINGNYMLVATNASGCSDTAMVSLNMSIGPALGADQSVNACSGSTINLTSLYTTGSFTVSWTSGGVAVPNPAAVSTAGIYTLIASNTNGCADTALVTVTLSVPPSLGSDQVHDICSNTFLDLTSLYNTTGLTSSWTINGIAVPVPTAVSAAGIYTLVATDLNNCSDQAAVTVNSLTAPGLGPDQNTAFCPGGTADLTTLYSTAGFITSWTLSGVPVANQSGINVPGTYQLIATSTNGCSDTANTIVTAANFPVIGADQQITACDNQPVNLTSVYNTSGYTSVWSSNGVPVSDPTIVNTAGTYQIVCTNAAGCSASANVTLGINQAPVLGNDQSLSICSGTVTDLTALYSLTGLTPQWSVNGTPVPDPTNAGTAGNYQLVASNSNNCFDTAIVALSITTGPSLGTDQSFELCPWMTLNFNSLYDVTGLNATWSMNGQSIQNYTAVYDSGMYQVFVTDVNGCTDEATVVVENIYCECNVDFTYEGKCMKDPVTFIVMADSAITGVHWSFSNPLIPESYALEPIVSFPSSDIVLVTLEAVLSCGTRIVEKNVKMENCEDSCRVYIPSAFTPNNDGKNEGFKSVTECTPLAYEMEIWNSFGQSVFKSEDYGHAWDGKNYPEGVYIYHVNYQMPYQTKKTVTGRVTVLR